MKKISKCIPYVLGALAIVSVVVMAASLLSDLRESEPTLKEQHREWQMLLARNAASEIEVTFDLLTRELKNLAEAPDIKAMRLPLAEDDLKRAYEQVKSLYVNDIALIGLDGLAKASINDNEIIGNDFSYAYFFVSSSTLDPGDSDIDFLSSDRFDAWRTGAVVAMPIFSDVRTFKGVVAMHVDFEKLISEVVPAANDGTLSLIVTSNGDVMFQSESDQGYLLNAASLLGDTGAGILASIKEGKEASLEHLLQDGIHGISSTVPLDVSHKNLALVVTSPLDEAPSILVSIFGKYSFIASVSLLMMVLCTGVILFLTRSGGSLTVKGRRRRDGMSLSDRYKGLLEVVDDIVWETDENWIYTYVSPSVKDVLGYDPDDIIGQDRFSMVPTAELEDIKPMYDENRTRLELTGNVVCHFRDAHGNRVPLETTAGTITDSDGNVKGFRGVDKDITEQDQQNQMLSQSLSYRQKIIDGVAEPIMVIGRDYEVKMMNRSAKEFTLGNTAVPHTLSKCYELSHKRMTPCVGTEHPCPLEMVLKTGKPVTVVHEHREATTGDNRYVEVIASPIFEDGIVQAVVECTRDITNQRQRQLELEAIAGVTEALRSELSRDEMLDIMLEKVVETTNADASAIAIYYRDKYELVVEHANGSWKHWKGLCMTSDEGISANVIATGKHFIYDNLKGQEHAATCKLFGDIESAVCVPLITNEQSVGVLWIGRKSQIHERDLNLLFTLGDIAANSIHRMSLYEQTLVQLERLDALRTIDMAITASQDLRVTLKIFIEEVIAKLKVDAASVLLLNPYSNTLELIASKGFASKWNRRVIGLGEDIAGRAVVEQRIINITDLKTSGTKFADRNMVPDEGFVSYIASPLTSKGTVKGVMELFGRGKWIEPEWIDFVEALSLQAAIAIDNARLFENAKRSNIEITKAYDTTLEGWSRALDMRDSVTEGHSKRVTDMTLTVAQEMDMKEEDLANVRRGALLHDIGKMGLSDTILFKEGPLDDTEWAVMREHPIQAYKLLSPIEYLKPALEIPLFHHERFDGSGYPFGLRGTQIPLAARIFAVVDVWDALSSDRPYRKAWSEEEVIDFVNKSSGTYFDPEVVSTFLKVLSGDMGAVVNAEPGTPADNANESPAQSGE